MLRTRTSLLVIVLLATPILLSACRYEPATPPAAPAVEMPVVDPDALAVLTEDLGTYELPISTKVPLAQKFFNQGPP